MHWACFHYEFEHFAGEGDPDEACGDPSCPARAFDPRSSERIETATGRIVCQKCSDDITTASAAVIVGGRAGELGRPRPCLLAFDTQAVDGEAALSVARGATVTVTVAVPVLK